MTSSRGAVRPKRILNPILLLWLVFAAIAALTNSPDLQSEENLNAFLLDSSQVAPAPLAVLDR